eukprot:XP_001708945.1 Hypothetical protein GL50803_23948 [Giardia lamblia ATCC 50803]
MLCVKAHLLCVHQAPVEKESNEVVSVDLSFVQNEILLSGI